MAALSYGRIDEFQPENKTIAAYLERVELFFSANDIVEEKRVPVFLSVMVERPIRYYAISSPPTSASEKGLDCLTATLKGYVLLPRAKEGGVAEQFHFH